MSTAFSPITNLQDAPSEGGDAVAPWAAAWLVLTPHTREAGGRLGVVLNRLPTGSVGCPFHWHATEDEVFYVVSGRGVLRYGDETLPLGTGDCVSCPAGKQVAHQIGNPYEEELLYLAIGNREPNVVCGYPDTGKVMVRHTQTVGQLEAQEYLAGEPNPPKIFADTCLTDH